jgi:hypothetical protein
VPNFFSARFPPFFSLSSYSFFFWQSFPLFSFSFLASVSRLPSSLGAPLFPLIHFICPFLCPDADNVISGICWDCTVGGDLLDERCMSGIRCWGGVGMNESGPGLRRLWPSMIVQVENVLYKCPYSGPCRRQTMRVNRTTPEARHELTSAPTKHRTWSPVSDSWRMARRMAFSSAPVPTTITCLCHHFHTAT